MNTENTPGLQPTEEIMGSKKEVYAGIDIGGTKLYAVITDKKGKILGKGRKKTKAHLGFDTVMERVEKCLAEACDETGIGREDLSAVGIGAPSPILPDGTAISAPNLPGWENVPIVKILSRKFSLPVFAENDVNAGTLGEYALGAGKGAKTLVGLFMGTGLGGGLIYHGEVMRGENCMAAELGHLIMQVGGRRCGCGNNGCLEAYASKLGMGRRFNYEIGMQGRESVLTKLLDGDDYSNVKSSVLAKAWEEKDEVVRETLAEACLYLGAAVGSLINALGPDRVVLGGGVFEALGHELLPLVKDSAKDHTHPKESYKDTKITLAKLADDAVALGAMVYARDSLAAQG